MSRAATLVTTERAVAEARRRIALGLQQPALLGVIDRLTDEITVAAPEVVAHLIPDSEVVLRDAIPSRNGSTNDAHLLALAWAVGGDIWTHDRDFAGTGVASWSTANLILGLAFADG